MTAEQTPPLAESDYTDARLRVAYYLEVLDSFFGDEEPFVGDVIDHATGDPDSAALLLSDLRLLVTPPKGRL